VSSVVDEAPGQRAREALARHDWGEAYEVLTEADRAGNLGPGDLEVLAQSAWWVGQQDTARDAWERAYSLYARSFAFVLLACAHLLQAAPRPTRSSAYGSRGACMVCAKMRQSCHWSRSGSSASQERQCRGRRRSSW
jgi:hypothetical protein